VVDKKETVMEVINIFTTYPPLTSRLESQLNFLKVCLKNNSVKDYLANRNFKYRDQLKIVERNFINKTLPFYFPS